jgi:hypothetical protein
MKRVFIGLMVLALALSLTSAALAAGPKVPKNLCFIWDTYSFVTESLLVKSMGTIKTADGPVKAYNLTGWHGTGLSEECAITGSGYVGADGLFHFTYTGTAVVGTTTYNLVVEAALDTVTGTGPLTFTWMKNIATGTDVLTSNLVQETITVIGCDSAPAPLAAGKGKGKTPTTIVPAQ